MIRGRSFMLVEITMVAVPMGGYGDIWIEEPAGWRTMRGKKRLWRIANYRPDRHGD